MTLEEFKLHVKEHYGSVNRYCEEKEDALKKAGISRATFYSIFRQDNPNPTAKNLIAFAEVSGVPLEEVTNVFIFRHRDQRSGN
jgi:hypothetical protein